MKLIKVVLVVISLTFYAQAYSQVKYTTSGLFGIGRTPSYKLDVNGTTRLSGYVGINGSPSTSYPLKVTSYYGQTLRIDPATSSGSCIGSSTDMINFWESNTSFNKIQAQSFNSISDSTAKKNIESLQPGALQKVLNMRPVSFDFKDEEESKKDKKLKKIGLIAQEVELIIPEAVSCSELGKVKMLDYDMLIPVLIKAIQEQQIALENLEKEINKYKSDSTKLKSGSDNTINPINLNDIGQDEISNISTLEQNTPNPFSQNTEIKYYLAETAKNATLYIYNMNGLQIKHIQISQKGIGSIFINGSELRPGMYLYTLIADGVEVDTKRMILTE